MPTAITWIGTATVLLEAPGLRLLTDPVLSPRGTEHTIGRSALTPGVTYRSVADPALGRTQVGPIDVVLASHDHHRDNLDAEGLECARGAPLVLTTQEGAQRLRRRGVAGARGLKPGESYTWTAADAKWTVTATPARHAPSGFQWMAGSVVGFVVESPALPLSPLWFTGDTRWFAGLSRVIALHRPKIIFAHAGAAKFLGMHFSMTAGEVLKLIRRADPATVIPIHMDDWSHYSVGEQELRRRLGDCPRVRWLERGRREPLV